MEEMSQAAEASTQANAQSLPDKAVDPRPVYEVGFHVVPTVAEGDVAGVVEKIRAEIAKGNAEIITEQFPTRMTLAYMVERATSGKREKYTEAYFGFIKFATEREHIAALEGMLRATNEVLRYLLVETVREDAPVRRAIFTSDRLEGETIKKPASTPEESRGPVSEEELEKSIEALTS